VEHGEMPLQAKVAYIVQVMVKDLPLEDLLG
jgi:hypothetical protein